MELLVERRPFEETALAAPYSGLGTLPVCVLLDHVRSMYNVGAFFRTADGVRAERLYLCGITAKPDQPGVAKTALGGEANVAWEHYYDALVPMRMMASRGYQIAAMETADDAVDIFDWQPRWPVCVVFGNEVDGVGDALLPACDVKVRLPMRGVKYSLNVATAGGVVLYELLRKYRRLHEARQAAAGHPGLIP
jgi:tRNA G18 (ribose-2'-O)-methylase SpoU